MNEAGLSFRTHTDADLPFIHSSWASSYYDGTHAKKYLTPNEFHTYHRQIRERYLARSNKQVLVCTPDDDHWHIIGWIATETIPSAVILHYLYVKALFRSKDDDDKGPTIAAQLLKRAIQTSPVVYTHLTEHAAKIIASKSEQFNQFKYIPHIT
jgi:hypothetical protein